MILATAPALRVQIYADGANLEQIQALQDQGVEQTSGGSSGSTNAVAASNRLFLGARSDENAVTYWQSHMEFIGIVPSVMSDAAIARVLAALRSRFATW